MNPHQTSSDKIHEFHIGITILNDKSIACEIDEVNKPWGFHAFETLNMH